AIGPIYEHPCRIRVVEHEVVLSYLPCAFDLAAEELCADVDYNGAHARPPSSASGTSSRQRPQVVFQSCDVSMMNQASSAVGGTGMQRQPLHISRSSSEIGTTASRVLRFFNRRRGVLKGSRSLI